MAARRTRPFTETREQIIIEGESVKIVTTTTQRVVKLGDFLTNVGTQSGISSPILPNGCRFFYKKGRSSIVMVEKPPQTRTIRWVWNRDRDGNIPAEEKVSWRLAFPFTVFTFSFVDLNIIAIRIHYNTKSISASTDELCHTNLCNVDSVDTICTGNVRASGNSISEKAENFIASFWQSEFNRDYEVYHFHPDARTHKQLMNLATWEKSSTEDPLFPLSLEWRKSLTVEKTIEDMMGRL